MGNKLNTNYSEAISSLQSAMGRFIPKRIYEVIFRGKSLEFDRYRDYSSEDDASLIDWAASARSDRILARQYKEERQLKIMFVIDVGESMVFGSSEKLKCEFAAEIAAALSYVIMDYDNEVGYFLFSDRLKKLTLPESSDSRFHMFLNDLSNSDFYGGITNLNIPLDYFNSSISSEGIDCIFFISDFLNFDRNMKRKFAVFSEKFETICLVIKDPLDISLPKKSRDILIENPKTKEQFLINPKKVGKVYEKNAIEHKKNIEKFFNSTRLDFENFETNKKFVPILSSFLKRRIDGAERKS